MDSFCDTGVRYTVHAEVIGIRPGVGIGDSRMSAGVTFPTETLWSRAERWEIAEQLGRILRSPWFRASPRCSMLLRHVVETTFDNDWATGISAGRRFELKADYANKVQWIEDTSRPGMKIGEMNLSGPEPANYDVYSIVMREFGQVTREPHVLLAGIGAKGDLAASEFVSNPNYLDEFMQHVPKGAANRSVELLLKTQVVENVAGIPTVVDYAVW